MTNLKLYQLSDQYLQLAQKLADMDLDAQTISDTIEASGLTDDFTAKAQNVEMMCRELSKDIPAIDAEIQRLKELKERRERVANGLRDYLMFNMQRTGIDRIDSPLFSIRIQNNPPSVEIFDESQVPKQYFVPKYVISKSSLKQDMQAGQEIAGARMVQSKRLVIK